MNDNVIGMDDGYWQNQAIPLGWPWEGKSASHVPKGNRLLCLSIQDTCEGPCHEVGQML